jgi:alcohol dehydrogenase class IV
MLLPHVVRWNGAVAIDQYAALVRFAGRAANGNAAEDLAGELESLAGTAGIGKRLKDGGVEENSLPELAAQAAQQWTGTFNPRPFDAAGALEIYKAAF